MKLFKKKDKIELVAAIDEARNSGFKFDEYYRLGYVGKTNITNNVYQPYSIVYSKYRTLHCFGEMMPMQEFY